jgi:hypothetical protein
MIKQIKDLLEIILYITLIICLFAISAGAYSIYKSNSLEYERGYHEMLEGKNQ